jgi:hypothetical protein
MSEDDILFWTAVFFAHIAILSITFFFVSSDEDKIRLQIRVSDLIKYLAESLEDQP